MFEKSRAALILPLVLVLLENSRKTEDENEKEDEKEALNRICNHALNELTREARCPVRFETQERHLRYLRFIKEVIRDRPQRGSMARRDRQKNKLLSVKISRVYRVRGPVRIRS